MNLPKVAITRPITIIMVYLSLILMGLISLTKLPVELYPNVSFGEISIIVGVRGGIPPTEVEELVTKPIEESVSTVSHLEEILSVSKEGESTTVLSFNPETNMNFAALEVREKLARVKPKLPKEIEKPIIAQFKQSDVPIVIIAIVSEKRTTEDIRKIVDEQIKERFKRITGVANVEVGGGRERKILVEVDQKRLFYYKISLDTVLNVLGVNNVNVLAGDIERTKDKYLIRVMGSFDTLDQIKNIPVVTDPLGAVVRLKDIAQVADSYLEPTTYARLNTQPVVNIYVQKESTANTIKVAEKVLSVVDEVRRDIPPDLRVIITSNQAEFIKKSISNLWSSLLKGSLLIIMVLLIFLKQVSRAMHSFLVVGILVAICSPMQVIYPLLIFFILYLVFSRRARAMLSVVLSIPISVIITFMLMKSYDLTINFITLFGLALGVGMLVDNSIVVYENILDKKEKKVTHKDAVFLGADEMFSAIISSTLTTIIVFLPMIFSQEIRLMYGGIAWTVTFSLLVSLFVAITLVPMIIAHIGNDEGENGKDPAEAASRPVRRFFFCHPVQLVRDRWRLISWPKRSGRSSVPPPRIIKKSWPRMFMGRMILRMKRIFAHRRVVVFMVRRRYLCLVLVLGAFIGALFLANSLGKEYLGSTEQNKFTIFIELPTGAKLETSDAFVRKVEKMLQEIPEVKTISSRVEAWSSKVYVELSSLIERKRSISQVQEELRPKVAKLRPAFIYFEESQEVGTKEIILDVFGYDYDVLREIAVSIATRLGEIPGLTDAKIRMREGRPEMDVIVRRDRASLFGLSVHTIAMAIHAQMRGMRATLFHANAREVETIARLDEKYRKTFSDLHRLVIMAPDNETQVLCEQVADFKYGLGPSEIWRKGKSRMVQVSANVGAIPLSQAVVQIEQAVKDIKFPKDYFYRFGGNYPMMVKTSAQFKPLIWFVLLFVYLVLAAQFESYSQPFIIMIAVPPAIIGGAVILYLTKRPISMGVLVGVMMLAGIVVNNAIIMVDHINRLRKEEVGHIRSLVRGSRDRLRPIMSTTLTTILGLLPMAFDKSEGANLWAPLAITVSGGLSFSTLLTVFLVPCIYLIVEDFVGLARSLWLKVLQFLLSFTKQNVMENQTAHSDER